MQLGLSNSSYKKVIYKGLVVINPSIVDIVKKTLLFHSVLHNASKYYSTVISDYGS